MNPIMSLFIDDKPKRPEILALPEMSLGSSCGMMNRNRFEVAIEPSALIDFLEPAYLEWVEESKRDDEQCGGPQDELAEAGYPTLKQLLEHPDLLELVLGHYLLQKFLRELTWNGSEPIEYWLDLVTDCYLDKGIIHLCGDCYSKRSN